MIRNFVYKCSRCEETFERANIAQEHFEGCEGEGFHQKKRVRFECGSHCNAFGNDLFEVSSLFVYLLF